MPYYPKKDWTLLGFKKSNAKNKKIYALLENKETKKTTRVHFGDSRYPSYRNTTGVYLSPSMIHGDSERRRLYKSRSKGKVRPDSYSASHFSFYYLWIVFYIFSVMVLY